MGAGGLEYFPIWWFSVSANTFPFASCRKAWEGQGSSELPKREPVGGGTPREACVPGGNGPLCVRGIYEHWPAEPSCGQT